MDEPSSPMCWYCGEDCDGELTVAIEIEGVGSGDFPVCEQCDKDHQ